MVVMLSVACIVAMSYRFKNKGSDILLNTQTSLFSSFELKRL